MRLGLNTWKNLSIAKKLYSVVGVMTVLIAIELLTLRFSMNTLSAVRAFVGGEGLWSKAQKDSAISLQRYGTTQDEADYRAFLGHLKLPEGDHVARVELLKADPDIRILRSGFIQGHIHPADVEPMVALIRRFYFISYLDRAIKAWTKADHLLDEFKTEAASYHVLLNSGRPDAKRLADASSRLVAINEQLTSVEEEFSGALGEGSRWLESIVISLLTLAVLMVEFIGLSLTFFTTRAISRGLAELNAASARIGAGDFSTPLTVRSKDELGTLTESILKMGRVLEGSYRELENRVQLRTRDLERTANENVALYEKANAAIQTRDEFMAVASHELKTPITALLLQLQLIKRTTEIKSRELEPDKIHGLAEKSILQAQKLSRLLEELLDLTRIRSGRFQLKLERFDLRTQAAELVSELAVEVRRAGSEIITGEGPPVFLLADPTRINQILTNLLSNALKYGEGKPITLKIEQSASFARVQVRDQGLGIPVEKQNQIFERFERASAEDSSISGLGLGLFITKQIVDAHGGRIAVESEPGLGSTFTVEIPLRPSAGLRISTGTTRPDSRTNYSCV